MLLLNNVYNQNEYEMNNLSIPSQGNSPLVSIKSIHINLLKYLTKLTSKILLFLVSQSICFVHIHWPHYYITISIKYVYF